MSANEKILNMYSFVKTMKTREDPQFVKDRFYEYQLMQKQRTAVGFCKNLLGIKMTDITRISQEEKDSIVNCLETKFLSKDPNYFGNRSTVYLDLHEY
jgi:hypothetical protein